MEIVRTYEIRCEPDKELLGQKPTGSEVAQGWEDLIAERSRVKEQKVKVLCPSCAYPMEAVFRGKTATSIVCSYCQERFTAKQAE